MSVISEKYNIPQETVQRMVKDGVISCSWPAYDAIYYEYKKKMAEGTQNKTSVIYELAARYNRSERNIRYIIARVDS